MWPGILAGLWPRLWPAARREFAAWVTLSPPQVGDLKYIPWLYAVPLGREKQWPSHVIVNPLGAQAVSRGARWLMGEPDATLDELLVECPFPDGSVTHLSRIARAAERLDRVRRSPEVVSGTELARTLAAIAPTPTGALRHKTEALSAVHLELATASPSAIRALANLDAGHYPANAMPSAALQRWVLDQLPVVAPSDLMATLKVFVAGQAQSWWLDAFRDALRAGLGSVQPAWCKMALFWMCNMPDVSALSSNIVEPAKLEVGVVNVVENTQLTAEHLQALRRATHILAWSRLHAAAVWLSSPPVKAFAKQLRFPTNAWDGIGLLLKRASDKDLVLSAVELEEPGLLTAAARRTIVNPTLLRPMDLSLAGWRLLWAKHLAGGGVAWPAEVDQDAEASKFLHAIVANHYEPGPIAKLPADFAASVLILPVRDKFWSRMDANEARLLAQETAKIVLETIGNGEAFPQPERPLLDAVFAQAERMKLTAAAIVTLISWIPTIDERAVQIWVRGVSCAGEAGRQLGRAIRDQYWDRIAKDLFNRFLLGDKDVLPALIECKKLLWWWDQLRVPEPGSAGNTALTREDVVRRTGELGGKLAPTSLDDIWERAGGLLKVLPAYGTPAERWNQASRKADSGALAGGLTALVDLLIADLPYNRELTELRNELQRKLQ
jgi:hypothetical protein